MNPDRAGLAGRPALFTAERGEHLFFADTALGQPFPRMPRDNRPSHDREGPAGRLPTGQAAWRR